MPASTGIHESLKIIKNFAKNSEKIYEKIETILRFVNNFPGCIKKSEVKFTRRVGGVVLIFTYNQLYRTPFFGGGGEC